MKETAGGLAYTLYAHDGSRPAVYVNTGGSDIDATGLAGLATNTWTHLAATYDGANVRLYVNGALSATRAVTGALRASSNPLRIGNSPWGEYLSGSIDDVRVYTFDADGCANRQRHEHAGWRISSAGYVPAPRSYLCLPSAAQRM